MYQNQDSYEQTLIQKMSQLKTESDKRAFLEKEATHYMGRKREHTCLSQPSLEGLSETELLERTIRYFR